MNLAAPCESFRGVLPLWAITRWNFLEMARGVLSDAPGWPHSAMTCPVLAGAQLASCAITPRISLVAVCCSRLRLAAVTILQLLEALCFSAEDSASCWRSSVFVCACSATDVFTTARRSVAFLLLEPFLVVLAIKQKHNELLLAGERKYDRIGSRRWNKSPAAELTFTSGG